MNVTVNSAQIVLDKIKQILRKKGQKAVRNLAKTFRSLESYDDKGKVDKDDFLGGLKENGIQISKNELDILLKYLDKYCDGLADVEEFLVSIRGKLSENRQQLVDSIFQKLDQENTGFILASNLKGFYNASYHPKVQKGQLAEDQVFLDFIQNFGDGSLKYKINGQDWNDYYAAVSSAIESDDHFNVLMKNCWKFK